MWLCGARKAMQGCEDVKNTLKIPERPCNDRLPRQWRPLRTEAKAPAITPLGTNDEENIVTPLPRHWWRWPSTTKTQSPTLSYHCHAAVRLLSQRFHTAYDYQRSSKHSQYRYHLVSHDAVTQLIMTSEDQNTVTFSCHIAVTWLSHPGACQTADNEQRRLKHNTSAVTLLMNTSKDPKHSHSAAIYSSSCWKV